MMFQKTLFYASLMLSLVSCKKDDLDYRTKYTGNFDFTVIEEFWLLGQPTQFDTSTFTGTIRKFSIEDVAIDLDENDFHYNTIDDEKRITITFSENKMITPEIADDGTFMLIQAHHYFHEGGFIDNDKIEFSITNLGGLGGGWNYYVSGKRK
jgi:hypothetical protein